MYATATAPTAPPTEMIAVPRSLLRKAATAYAMATTAPSVSAHQSIKGRWGSGMRKRIGCMWGFLYTNPGPCARRPRLLWYKLTRERTISGPGRGVRLDRHGGRLGLRS